MEAQTLTDNENRDLRFDIPNRFIILTQNERMIISRGVYHAHLEKECSKRGTLGVIVYGERFTDCAKCRSDRITVFQRKSTFFHRPSLDYGQDSDEYWCNTCQGTGWILTPTENIVEELNILTVETKLQSMTTEEFTKVLLMPRYLLPFTLDSYPEGAVKAEAARRMASSNVQSKSAATQVA